VLLAAISRLAGGDKLAGHRKGPDGVVSRVRRSIAVDGQNQFGLREKAFGKVGFLRGPVIDRESYRGPD
jgi:hypothetical protein